MIACGGGKKMTKEIGKGAEVRAQTRRVVNNLKVNEELPKSD
jgi:hypothetical protein